MTAAGNAQRSADADGHRRLGGVDPSSFRLLIEHNADGVLVVSVAGAVLYANPAAARIFGHPPEALVGAPLGRPVVCGETTQLSLHRPALGPVEVEMRTVEIVWDDQPAILASLRDVSDRLLQEEDRRQAQKLEAIGRLTAGIAHDFNNLVAVIQSGLRLLRKQLAADPGDARVGMLMDEVLKGTRRAGALTQQLLAFSRRQSLSPQPIDLNALVRSLVTLLGPTLGRGVRVRTVLAPGLSPVHVDANQLEMALLNLAVNARDAMSGEGQLTIETSRGGDDLPGDAAGGRYAMLTVSDTGCGMPKEALAHVFEPFFTTKGDGTGLGLSQVYGFVTQSGGHVRIESEVGAGTRVHLLLPAAHGSGPG